MATTHERKRWVDQLIRDHPYMANLPGAAEAIVELYCSDRKSFNKLVEECKRMEADPKAKSKILPEILTYGIRKGEAEVRQSEDDNQGFSEQKLPVEPVERSESQPGDDSEQPTQDSDP